MRKKIALYLGETTGELQEKITKAIAKYANRKNYDVLTFCTYGTYNDDYLYAEGEIAAIHIPDFSLLDGVILTEDVYNIDGMADKLYEVLKKDATCPVVYMRTTREGFHSVLAENQKSMELMTRHFIEEHGFRDICYMSGKEGSLDAIDRLQGFMNVMEEYDIPVTDHMIFHGDYWRNKGKEAVDWFMEGRESYPQAIICANDYMAISICDELKNRKVKIPEEVCVSGVDYILEAKYNHPSITSLAVDYDKMSEEAISIIDTVNHGGIAKDVVSVSSELMLHKSCGCGKQANLHRFAVRVVDDQDTIRSMKHIMASASEYQDAFEEDEFYTVTEKYADLFDSKRVFLCMCDMDEKDFAQVENDSFFSKNMILKRIFYDDKRADKMNTVFSRTEILPRTYWETEEPRNYIIFSLHFKNTVFGYLVSEIDQDSWVDIFVQAYIMNLANAIQNMEVQKKISDLESIRTMYQKDELTGLYNRRGFDKLLKDRLSYENEEKGQYHIVSIDMDGLKYINDTFGHVEGDRSLAYLAEALQSVMGEDEFCARNGGDEFAAMLHGDINRVHRFEEEFEQAMAEINSLGLDYPIGASFGWCTFYEKPDDTVLSCIQKADMRMYENKKLRKSQGKTIR